MPGSEDFQKSITLELDVIKNRVRDLIGNANWPEEGRYKEAILSKSIENQLPKHISVGTGFIVRKENAHSQILSKQHDIIIYDNRYPLIMEYGNFIVTTPANTLGVIEVKSNMTPALFQQTFKKLEESLDPLFDSFNDKFIGIFSFSFKRQNRRNYTIDSEHLIPQTLAESRKIVNHISLDEKTFIRFWESHEGANFEDPLITEHDFYNVYELEKLSYSYFISNILHRVCDNIDDRYWHSFPIHGTKERLRIRTIEIMNNAAQHL